MAISANQLNNILRVYGDQIRQSMISSRPEDNDMNEPDRISTAAKSRLETIINDITLNIIERITQKRSHDNVEKKVLKTLERKHEKSLAINDDRSSELIFKEIDENSETTNSLSIENFKLLKNKTGGKK